LPSVVAQALHFLFQCCVQVFLSLSPGVAVGGNQWEVQALSSGIRAEFITGVVCQRRFSSLGRGDYSYDVELYASAKMFASA
jgi:hypothetical protein